MPSERKELANLRQAFLAGAASAGREVQCSGAWAELVAAFASKKAGPIDERLRALLGVERENGEKVLDAVQRLASNEDASWKEVCDAVNAAYERKRGTLTRLAEVETRLSAIEQVLGRE